MSTILAIREAMKSTLAAQLVAGTNQLAQVETHGGRFDLDELKRWAVKAPAIFVGAVGFPATDWQQQLVADVDWAAFVIAKDTAQMRRDSLVLALVEAALNVIQPIQRWGLDGVHAMDALKASNLYSGNLDKTGVAIWAITWTQGYDCNPFDPTALADLLRVDTTTSISTDPNVPTMQAETDLPAAD